MNRNYEDVLKHVKGVLEGETDLTANLANVAAILKILPGYFWVGFYIVKNGVLVLGPFQGPVACTRIAFGKGVCGTAWKEKQSILVPDVNEFPGHIACNASSQSELVVPIFDADGNVFIILDADSDSLNAFNENDRDALEQIASLITDSIKIAV
ncbi:GAF domain-containing protein [Cryomorpha ignava]|uniref:GAF domain-containing protein n=1 Tax=Cryomorpha ignava TaxID=101383 RepID=A0A7K3WLZ8_9FLAO|nr:GAF domain-containing protein [Cryomorpha ignava]NEN22051.1 GAF domain-containing protein [Cryomorpha ignava]